MVSSIRFGGYFVVQGKLKSVSDVIEHVGNTCQNNREGSQKKPIPEAAVFLTRNTCPTAQVLFLTGPEATLYNNAAIAEIQKRRKAEELAELNKTFEGLQAEERQRKAIKDPKGSSWAQNLRFQFKATALMKKTVEEEIAGMDAAIKRYSAFLDGLVLPRPGQLDVTSADELVAYNFQGFDPLKEQWNGEPLYKPVSTGLRLVESAKSAVAFGRQFSTSA